MNGLQTLVDILEPCRFVLRKTPRLMDISPKGSTWRGLILSWAIPLVFAIFFPPVAMSQQDLSQPGTPMAEMKSDSAGTSQTAEVNYLGQKNFPKVIALDPVNGATDVDPNTKYITVTYDRPMKSGYSWVDGGKLPKLEKSEWINDKQCRARVTLEPGREYGVWLNFDPRTSNFKSQEGISAERVYWTFGTSGTPTTAQPVTSEAGGAAPQIVSKISPAQFSLYDVFGREVDDSDYAGVPLFLEFGPCW